MMKLAEWAQRIVTFRAGAVELLADAGWIFKAHMFLGMTLFLVFPFTRLVHVWSGFAHPGLPGAAVPGGAHPPHAEAGRARPQPLPRRPRRRPAVPDLVLEPGKTA